MKKTVVKLLEEKKFSVVKEILKTLNAPDAAILMGEMSEADMPILFRLFPKELAADTFAEMEADGQAVLLSSFQDRELREVFSELYLDDAVDIIEEMPANVVTRILRNVDPDLRTNINKILQYPEDSAGSIMTIEYVELKTAMTVGDAIARIRQTGYDKETIYTCYVTADDRKLIGVVSVRTLLLARDTDLIGDVMEQNVISVQTTDTQNHVVAQFDKYGFLALPVTDGEGRLVGIATVDDAMDVLREAADDEIAKMAAVAPQENTYLKTSVWKHASSRILWLLILMLSATFTGIILSGYEEAFSAYPLLVAFIPMLMDTGGNSGAQSAAMIIRGLGTEELVLKDFFRVLWKELRIGLFLSIVLAVVNFVRVLLFYGTGEIVFAMITSLTLIGTVILAKGLGCLLPMGAKLLRLDPALVASPLMTTVLDACSMVLYFTIATALLL